MYCVKLFGRRVTVLKLIVLLIISILTLLFFMEWRENDDVYSNVTFEFSLLGNNNTIDGIDKYATACPFPQFNAFDPTITHLVYHPRSHFACERVQPYLTYVDYQGYLRFNDTEVVNLKFRRLFSKLICNYQTFDRSPGVDDSSWTLDDERQLTTPVRLQRDSVRVQCLIKEDQQSELKHYYINVHAHPVKKPKNTYKKPTNNQLSVLLMGIDSVSHSNLRRNMPLTYQYVTKQMKMFMFDRMNKIGDNTLPNMMAILTGKRIVTEQPDMKSELIDDSQFDDRSNQTTSFNGYYDDFPLIWKDFAKKGYAVTFSEDKPFWSLFHFMAKGFSKKPVDYYYMPFWRVWEEEARNEKWHEFCFGNTPKADIFVDLIRRQMTTLNETLQFVYAVFNQYSHDSDNEIQGADLVYLNFFREMFEKGYLNKTVVVFLSDHGRRYGSMRGTLVGLLESRNPFYGLWFPDWFYKMYPHIKRNLLLNTQRFSSTFDIHETLKDILHGNYNGRQRQRHQRAFSHLYEMPLDRFCRQAGVPDHFCLCLTDFPLNVSSPFLISAAETIVKHLNSMLLLHTNSCITITLEEILRAQGVWFEGELQKGDKSYSAINKYYSQKFNKNVNDAEKVRVVVKTEPNGAIFEALLMRSNDDNGWKVENEVERLTAFGNSSLCIQDGPLRKYCTCQ